ncbi:reverse transcriptase (RNA-dependent DNA polymerase) [Paraburkholderia sp. BL6669N2]|uniref:antiviral reverse transcriptase Drt2 n=1 Tax=Paraburkholderia sp. BL6669N2 TaxID=1938807 RepID=UPI000E242D39|nr:antiviral reverse transcriptase Drt2 [Paraburkholderia sp. BL6669N2]REG60075.1 reverse transcriptase (RNA-dependent DNA polymerase) [Paraburkholderia sp. BL6669N2]
MTTPLEWYRRRTYLHFDMPISENAATAITGNPDVVARHAFYPLINFTINSKKVKWDPVLKKLSLTSKERPVSYASHVDSHIYAYYAAILSEKYEAHLKSANYESAVLAFRKLGKSNIHFAKEAFTAIKKLGNADVITTDIKDFFGNLDHQILRAAWRAILGVESLPSDHYNVFKSLTRFSWVDKRNLYAALHISPNNPRASGPRICEPEAFRKVVRACKLIETNPHSRGIPQGSPISALLSNIYMVNFDEMMWDAVTAWGGKYFRYCDDMLIIAPHGKGKDLLNLAREFSDLYKLPLHPDKTEERTFTATSDGLTTDKPLQYLGFLFDGKRVVLRSASLARYSDRMKRGVRLAKATMRSRNDLRVGRGEAPTSLHKRKLYKRYSYLGRRNFVSYALRAAGILEAKEIKRQVKPLWKRLRKQMT